MSHAAQAQVRPYIGYAYPAGGQQGTTFQVKLGGQNLDGANEVLVSGTGVTAKVIECLRRLNNQETQLMREQLAELRRNSADKEDAKRMMAKIEKRLSEFNQFPACAAIAYPALVEVTIARDAKPGRRELLLATPRGVSNPLVFYVGQLPEVSRKPMLVSSRQVLGREEAALRTRPADEVEQRVTLPCTLNGQIASGEVNRYRFEARKGQRLVIAAQARELVPYIADAVPGWFQPVLTLCDANGKEVAYNDDYRFKPDPVILCEVPKDGEYVLTITDAIYRGREDFVYRISMGELPFVTSIFPLGARAGDPLKIDMKGWNLDKAGLTPPGPDAQPGVYPVSASGKDGHVSNILPFALDTLPECREKEPNNDLSHAQKVELPIIVNGRIERPGDGDVFRFTGRAGETVVAEVSARRLDSPLDSQLRLTDASGKVLAFNDDHEDLGAGVNTHHADSYLMYTLPADGAYCVHIGDTAHGGGEEYAYRLRLSAPQPDFALYIVPSSGALRGRSTAPTSVYAIRKDGFKGPIKLSVKEPQTGFVIAPASLPAEQTLVRLTVRTDLSDTKQPVNLTIQGRAEVDGREVVHDAVPAEDRMQAFLWRHLVPAQELKTLVYNPPPEPPRNRAKLAPKPSPEPKTKPGAIDPVTGKPRFTPQQVAARIRQLGLLLEEGVITKGFHDRKVAECEAAL
jgi:hypothetical protein